MAGSSPNTPAPRNRSRDRETPHDYDLRSGLRPGGQHRRCRSSAAPCSTSSARAAAAHLPRCRLGGVRHGPGAVRLRRRVSRQGGVAFGAVGVHPPWSRDLVRRQAGRAHPRTPVPAGAVAHGAGCHRHPSATRQGAAARSGATQPRTASDADLPRAVPAQQRRRVEDADTYATFRLGEVMPDWGFAERGSTEVDGRDLLVLSYRPTSPRSRQRSSPRSVTRPAPGARHRRRDAGGARLPAVARAGRGPRRRVGRLARRPQPTGNRSVCSATSTDAPRSCSATACTC